MHNKRINTLTISFLMLCFILCFAVLLKIDIKTRLSGVTDKAEYPSVSINSVLNGSYQAQYDDWFLENYPLRSYVLKTYNQFKYSILGKSANENLIIQKDKSVIEKTYLESYLAVNTTEKSHNETIIRYDEYCKNLKIIQDNLEEQGKAFIYLIAPSKAEVYAEDIPVRYIKNSQLGIYKNNHEILVDGLEKHGVNYFDSSGTMLLIKQNDKYSPFPTTGIHWTYYAAKIVTQDFFNTINENYNLHLPLPQIVNILELDKPWEGDDISPGIIPSNDSDIFNNLNIFYGKMDKLYTHPILKYEIPDDFTPISLMRLGTSFDTKLTYTMGLNSIFYKQNYFSYLKREYDVTDKGRVLTRELYNDVNMINFSKLVKNNDLFYIENTAVGVPDSFLIFAKKFAESFSDSANTTDSACIEIKCEADSLSYLAGQSQKITVTIGNNDSYRVITSKSECPFKLSYHILDSNGNTVLKEGQRTPLVADINPGETQEVDMLINVPEKPGEYILQVTYLFEGLYWGERFSDKVPINIPMTVK